MPLALVPDPDAMLSQVALDAAFQAQPVPAVTVNEPAVAAAPVLALPGERLYVQVVEVLPTAARKLAIVYALLLCTRTLSAVELVPSGSGGLP